MLNKFKNPKYYWFKVLLLLGIVLLLMLSILNFLVSEFSNNIKHELVNFRLLEYLVDNYYGNEDHDELKLFLDQSDYRKNAESISNTLNDKGIIVDNIAPELIIEFDEIMKKGDFDVTVYNHGRLYQLKNSRKLFEQHVYHQFSLISEDLLSDSSIYLPYDKSDSQIRMVSLVFAFASLLITSLLITLYYVIKFFSNKRQFNFSVSDGVVIIVLLFIFIFTCWRFLNISSETINYSFFFDGLNAEGVLSINFISLSKVVLYFLYEYIYEYTVCFILMISIGEYIYSRTRHKSESLYLANILFEIMEDEGSIS